eukprot:NODE_3994_length_1951_cov_8.578399.p1 GENE.NODE_3994_length_1951_cov_8.578399~~NODE_3994_length_1951_cov_8.578399.p1  ORF type:complete len:344 (-),score=98.92 NODE_3994_length_1951_cov_8.578399:446-1477(-)
MPQTMVRPDSFMGEVRYDSVADARNAARVLNGVELRKGFPLSIQMDQRSKDGTKLIIQGIPGGIEWQEMKDHFAQIGVVAFAEVIGAKGKGKGKGKTGCVGGSVGGCPPSMQATPRVGEVRFSNLSHVTEAVERLDGGLLNGVPIRVQVDMTSKDRSKLIVTGLPPGVQWQELKDYFNCIGPVAFANILAPLAADDPGSMASWPSPNMAGRTWPGQVGMNMPWFTPTAAATGLGGFTPMHAGGGGGGGCGAGGCRGVPMKRGRGDGGTPVGEVRFHDTEAAERAIFVFNGNEARSGSILEVERSPFSHDGKIVIVRNLPVGFKWQELKDLFSQVGHIAFAEVR